MSVEKKRAPQVSIKGMERIISKIYDDINDIINSVNQIGTEASETTGKEGQVRIIKDKSLNKYFLELFAEDGWVRLDQDSTTKLIEFKITK